MELHAHTDARASQDYKKTGWATGRVFPPASEVKITGMGPKSVPPNNHSTAVGDWAPGPIKTFSRLHSPRHSHATGPSTKAAGWAFAYYFRRREGRRFSADIIGLTHAHADHAANEGHSQRRQGPTVKRRG